MENSSDIVAPPVLTGWMRKQGRKGLIKNWKRRYFVLKYGKLTYYENEAKQFPLGEGQKGELNLMNTELELQEDHGKQQIYIVAFNGENNLLIETETEGETNRWTNALKQHIRFANKVSAQSSGSAPKPAAKSNSITELPTNNQNVATTPVDADDFDSDDDGSFAVESKPATAPTSVNEKDSAASANSSDSQTARAPSPTVESTPSAATESTAETKAPAARRASATASAPAPASASASAPTPAPVSKAAKVEKPSKGETASADLTTIDGVATHIMTFFQSVSNDKAYRNALAESVVPRVQSIGQGLSTHFFEGNPGERGEEFILSALAIFLMVLLGLGQLLILLVGWFIFLLAPFLVISGMLMVGSALWELDALASLWLLPNTSVANKKHKVVDSGVFGVVRHPMYGGLVLWVLGWAIFSNSVVKMVLSLVALVLLVFAARVEETHLLALHPKDYAAYQQKIEIRLIPFVY